MGANNTITTASSSRGALAPHEFFKLEILVVNCIQKEFCTQLTKAYGPKHSFIPIDIKRPSRDCKCFQGDDSIGIHSFSHIVGGLTEPHWNKYYVKHRQQWMVLSYWLFNCMHIIAKSACTRHKTMYVLHATPTPHTPTLWKIILTKLCHC